MILLIIQLQCFHISSLKQYKTSSSLSIIIQYSIFFSIITRSQLRKDNLQLSSELQKTVFSASDKDHSFFCNPQWIWKNSPYRYVEYNKISKNILFLKNIF